MYKIILFSLLSIILSACSGVAYADTGALPASGATPTRTATPLVSPDWRATAERAEYLQTQDILSIERQRLEFERDQAGTQNAAKFTGEANQYKLDQTLTAAEAYARVQNSNVQASATLSAVGATETGAAQSVQQTSQAHGATATSDTLLAYVDRLEAGAIAATQTADAPLLYVRQRMQMTQQSEAATATVSAAMSAQESADWSLSAWHWFIALVMLALFALAGDGIYHGYVLAHNKKVSNDMQARRNGVINASAGTVVVSEHGAQVLPSQNNMRPIYNLGQNGAGWAQPPQAEPESPVDPIRNLVAKLLLSCPQDSPVIPANREIGWHSGSARQAAVNWLVSAGAVETREGVETRITARWGTVGAVYAALESGELQVMT